MAPNVLFVFSCYGLSCSIGDRIRAKAPRFSVSFVDVSGPTRELPSSLSPFDEVQGPKFSDVIQGRGRDCYLLASLAALARSRPGAVQQLFEDAGTASNDGLRWVYSVGLSVMGKKTVVAVDDSVPFREDLDGTFWFAMWRGGNTFWPVLLEKACAKLFGSYMALTSGSPTGIFVTLTGAPVQYVSANNTRSWPDAERLWEFLRSGMNESRPTVAVSDIKTTIVQSRHSFVVLGVGFAGEGSQVRVVDIYNPWGSHTYSGVHKDQSGEGGSFRMTFEEFQGAFMGVTRSMWESDYKLHSLTLPVGAARLSFHLKDERRPAWVLVHWPPRRIFRASGCIYDMDRGRVSYLWVAARDKLSTPESRDSFDMHMRDSTQTVRVEGAGDYSVFVGQYFGDLSGVVDNVSISVYAHKDEDVTLQLEPGDPMPLALRMSGVPSSEGPSCEHLIYHQRIVFTFSQSPLQGGPAWVSATGKVIFADPGLNLRMAKSVDDVFKGQTTGIERSTLRCFGEKEQEVAKLFAFCKSVLVIDIDLTLQRTSTTDIPTFRGLLQQARYPRWPWGMHALVLELTDSGWALKYVGKSVGKIDVDLEKEVECNRDPDVQEENLVASPPPLLKDYRPPPSKSCDVQAAREALRRLGALNNFKDLVEGGEPDAEFPSGMRSIGNPEECKEGGCDNVKWMHISQRFRRRGSDSAAPPPPSGAS